ncbi:MAG: DNA-binding protein [Phascolarctobacterium sp.]|nr:DNA-binding protein [Phascolarctobacterium sp.]MBQ7759680.1 DNA-binding protein [Acidaminococcaceae bacterium]
MAQSDILSEERTLLEQDFEQRMRLGRLFDMYGGLLTEKQQQCLRFYFYDDLSLTEIGEELGVSRQAVHDLLKRVEQTLERNEKKLGLLARDEADKERLRSVIKLLADKQQNEKAIQILKEMCGESR